MHEQTFRRSTDPAFLRVLSRAKIAVKGRLIDRGTRQHGRTRLDVLTGRTRPISETTRAAYHGLIVTRSNDRGAAVLV